MRILRRLAMIEQLFLVLMGLSFGWMVLLALIFFSKIKLSENFLSQAVKYYSLIVVTVAFVLFCKTWIHSPSVILLDYNDWITVGSYRFKIRSIVDLLGSSYALLSAALISIIFKFSRNYLHKEEGYFRFIFLLSTLMFGLFVVSFSRALDQLFIGWELVGTASILLIGYFYAQVQPVKHAIKAIISYRLCDMGILAAGAWAHHYLHTTDFVAMPTMLAHAHHGGNALIFIGIFIIWASLAKAGQLPMSSWLPTAMEGPTPSSAIFYGALSVHLGPLLLIRMYKYFEHFPSLLIAIAVIGAVSAVYASLVGRTRSDAKTMLAYATISQVGIMYVEIALGYTNFAIFHIFAHASLRTFQFLRSSSLIQDFFENPLVQQNTRINRKLSVESFFSSERKRKVFIHALHGFHLDYITSRIIAGICFPFKKYMEMEDEWMKWDNNFLRKLFRKGPL